MLPKMNTSFHRKMGRFQLHVPLTLEYNFAHNFQQTYAIPDRRHKFQRLHLHAFPISVEQLPYNDILDLLNQLLLNLFVHQSHYMFHYNQGRLHKIELYTVNYHFQVDPLIQEHRYHVTKKNRKKMKKIIVLTKNKKKHNFGSYRISIVSQCM